jgi:F-type H+-transporting ATPase subunit gamma
MKSLIEYKQQIDQTQDLSNIITTMKNIAIVNMTHFERKLRSVRQYFSTVERGFQIFLQKDTDDFLEMLEEKKRKAPQAIVAVIIGSEKGLCGEFNKKIFNYFKNKNREVYKIIAIGDKISGYLYNEFLEIFDYPTSHEEILAILKNLISVVQNLLFEKRIGEVVFFHHQLLSGLSYEPVADTIFPLNLDWLKNLKARPWPTRCLPTYETDKETLFYELTQESLFISMYSSFINSLASENASRLSFMQTAEEKIQDQLYDLKQEFNIQKQNQITEELADIISSFEVLKKHFYTKKN